MAVQQKRSRIQFGAAPRADLLPDAPRAELRHERTMPKLLLAIVASAAAAGLIWVAGSVPVTLSNVRLQNAQNESTELIAQLATYSEVQQALGETGRLTQMRRDLSAKEVQYMDVRDEVIAGLPEGASLIVFSGTLPDGVSAIGELVNLDLNPLCTTEDATIILKVATEPLQPFAGVLDAAENLTGFKCVVGTKIEAGEEGAGRLVTLQIALNEEAYSGRFADKEAGK